MDTDNNKVSNVTIFKDVIIEMYNLYCLKNHDYGDSFAKGMDEFGPVYGISRLFDKMNRLIALHGREDEAKVLDEKYEDTLIDLANYAVMTIIYKRLNASKQV